MSTDDGGNVGIFDKAKDMVGDHNDEVDQAIDKAADLADDKTGGKYTEQIDQGAEQIKDQLDKMAQEPPAQA